MLYYLLLCFVSLLAGRGILCLMRIPLTTPLSFYLAPVLTLSLWAISLAWGVFCGFTIKELSSAYWIFTLVLAGIGLYKIDFTFKKNDLLLIALTFVLPILLMGPYFTRGLLDYPGSLAADGWSYIAYGQYLWTYPRGADGGLAPLYQYAAHLAHTRFIGSALLGFFSPVINAPGDTQAASNLFLAWCFFVFSSACAFFIATQKNIKLKPVYLVLAVFSGWLLNALGVNNFDNLLILSILPTFAGITTLFKSQSYRWAIIIAALIATTLFCYIELAVFILIGGMIFFLCHAWANKQEKLKVNLNTLFIVMIFSIIFVLPFIKEAFHFLISQMNISIMQAPGQRPGGGYFPGLVEPQHILNAFWGLKNNVINMLCALILSCLAALGLINLGKQKQWGLVIACLFLLICTFYMILVSHYAYGAYKIILLNWWLLIFAVITAVEYLFQRTLFKKSLAILLAVLSIVYLGLVYIQLKEFAASNTLKSIVPLRQLSNIESIVKDKAILVAVNDGIANEWAVYFLRNFSTKLMIYRIYMAQAHVLPYMHQAKNINPADIQFLLTDNSITLPQTQLRWSNGPYYLWALPKQYAFINQIENENGLETWNGKLGFWLGKGDTTLEIISSNKNKATISGTFTRGPSLPNKESRQLQITINHNNKFILHIKHDGKFSFVVPLATGTNLVQLRPIDRPTLPQQPNGDTRPLLIGLTDLSVNSF